MANLQRVHDPRAPSSIALYREPVVAQPREAGKERGSGYRIAAVAPDAAGNTGEFIAEIGSAKSPAAPTVAAAIALLAAGKLGGGFSVLFLVCGLLLCGSIIAGMARRRRLTFRRGMVQLDKTTPITLGTIETLRSVDRNGLYDIDVVTEKRTVTLIEGLNAAQAKYIGLLVNAEADAARLAEAELVDRMARGIGLEAQEAELESEEEAEIDGARRRLRARSVAD